MFCLASLYCFAIPAHCMSQGGAYKEETHVAELCGAKPRPAESIRVVVNPQPLSNVEQEINIHHSKLQVRGSYLLLK